MGPSPDWSAVRRCTDEARAAAACFEISNLRRRQEPSSVSELLHTGVATGLVESIVLAEEGLAEEAGPSTTPESQAPEV